MEVEEAAHVNHVTQINHSTDHPELMQNTYSF